MYISITIADIPGDALMQHPHDRSHQTTFRSLGPYSLDAPTPASSTPDPGQRFESSTHPRTPPRLPWDDPDGGDDRESYPSFSGLERPAQGSRGIGKPDLKRNRMSRLHIHPLYQSPIEPPSKNSSRTPRVVVPVDRPYRLRMSVGSRKSNHQVREARGAWPQDRMSWIKRI